jgi:hypothetical protein
MTSLDKALELFDTYNQQDPNVLVHDGVSFPSEYFYALRLYDWVNKLDPQASEPLLLASRCQHIGRWKIPRSEYPMNKPGYLNWRTNLAKFHAETAADLMYEAGYDDGFVKAVQHILLKKNLKSDHDVQVMEDALCLVFLEFQYEDFLLHHDEEKVLRIIRKSWSKMSEAGRNTALQLPFSEKGKALINRALQ